MSEIEIKDDGPAFPGQCEYLALARWGGDSGMSLRDYFAAQALLQLSRAEYQQTLYVDGKAWANWSPEAAAELAYRIADAMLKAREAK